MEQRQKQTSQIMDALFVTELDEATLTFQAWQDGLPIEANDKINPAALSGATRYVGASPEHVRNIVGPRR